MEGNARKTKIVEYLTAAEQAAAVLVEGAPLTYFLTGEQVDYRTALLREGVEIHVFLAGFGQINQAVLTALVSTCQFMTADGRGVKEQPVQYHIFDKDCTRLEDSLADYYRFAGWKREIDKGEYLPMPPTTAKEYFTQAEVDSPAFFKELERTTANEKALQFVIVALGDEAENLRFARKITAWRAKNHKAVQVFAYASAFDKDGEAFGEGEEEVLSFHEEEIYPIYDIERMAKYRNATYELERRVCRGDIPTAEEVKEAFAHAQEDWESLNPFLKKSNLYACLSLRSKLHLTGLDYAYDSAKQPFLSELAPARAILEEEYMQVYAVGDMPEYFQGEVDEKKVVRYTIEEKSSKRRNFALIEHQRWTAFMLAHGYVPASLDQIVYEKKDGKFTGGKNSVEKRHGNLTTYEGMKEYRRLLAKRDRTTEKEKDVFQYDYQIMDDAVWLLGKIDCVIVEKEGTFA